MGWSIPSRRSLKLDRHLKMQLWGRMQTHPRPPTNLFLKWAESELLKLNLMITSKCCKHYFTKGFHSLSSFASKITMSLWVNSLSELNKTYIHNLWPEWFKAQENVPSCLILAIQTSSRLFATLSWSVINTFPIFQLLSHLSWYHLLSQCEKC